MHLLWCISPQILRILGQHICDRNNQPAENRGELPLQRRIDKRCGGQKASADWQVSCTTKKFGEQRKSQVQGLRREWPLHWQNIQLCCTLFALQSSWLHSGIMQPTKFKKSTALLVSKTSRVTYTKELPHTNPDWTSRNNTIPNQLQNNCGNVARTLQKSVSTKCEWISGPNTASKYSQQLRNSNYRW